MLSLGSTRDTEQEVDVEPPRSHSICCNRMLFYFFSIQGHEGILIGRSRGSVNARGADRPPSVRLPLVCSRPWPTRYTAVSYALNESPYAGKAIVSYSLHTFLYLLRTTAAVVSPFHCIQHVLFYQRQAWI